MNSEFSAELISRLRKYADPFVAHPPSIISHFSGGAEPYFPFEIGSDKGLGVLLLNAALYAPGDEIRSAELISGLYSRMGDRIFKLNRIPFEELRKNLSGLPAPSDLEGRKRVPGILRSVCDFFYRTGSLGNWLKGDGDWEGKVLNLSGDVFWMGKTSRLRTKARYFLWLTTFQSDFNSKYAVGENFNWPISAGHARFRLDFMRTRGKNFTENTPEYRLQFFTKLARETFPSAPWRLFLPLSSYLKPGKTLGFECRRIQGGCPSCSLAMLCPSSTQLKNGRK